MMMTVRRNHNLEIQNAAPERTVYAQVNKWFFDGFKHILSDPFLLFVRNMRLMISSNSHLVVLQCRKDIFVRLVPTGDQANSLEERKKNSPFKESGRRQRELSEFRCFD